MNNSLQNQEKSLIELLKQNNSILVQHHLNEIGSQYIVEHLEEISKKAGFNPINIGVLEEISKINEGSSLILIKSKKGEDLSKLFTIAYEQNTPVIVYISDANENFKITTFKNSNDLETTCQEINLKNNLEVKSNSKIKIK